jgi:hypothetical protein
MEDEALKLSMIESKRKKKVAECLDRLMKERKIKIAEVDSTQWHKLVLDAERLARYEGI